MNAEDTDRKIFSAKDLRRWAEAGLISEAQSRAVLEHEAEALAASGRKGYDVERGLTLVTVLAIFGAFLALLGFTLFLTVAWDEWSESSRVLLTGVSALLLLISGYYAQARTSYRLAGGLLFMLGTALIPVVLTAAGEALSDEQFRSFSQDADQIAIVLGASTVVAAITMVAGRVHYTAFVVATLAILLAVAIVGSFDYESEETLWWTALAASGTVVGASAGLYLVGAPGHGLWSGSAGHIGFYASTVYLL